MASPKTSLPFGTWPSPISPAWVGAGARLSDIQWVPNSDVLVWCQSQNGQTSLIAKPKHEAQFELASGFNPSGGVGYGGGEFFAGSEGVVFADRDGRLYYQPYTLGQAKPITPAFGRAAAPVISPENGQVAYVHTYENKDVLAMVNLDGKNWPVILSQGADFYMQPAFSPDGQKIAWVEWDHPNMPWDGARLMLGQFDPGGESLTEIRKLDGNEISPTFQPAFSPDGKYLAYLVNRGEADQLVLFDLASEEKTILVDGKFLLQPAWVQGERVMAWSSDSNAIYYLAIDEASILLYSVDLPSGKSSKIDTGEFTQLEQPAVSSAGGIALIAQSSASSPRVLFIYQNEHHVIARSRSDSISPEDLPQARHISWKSSDGVTVHGVYYPPTNRLFTSAGLPPVIVYVHGGPTSQAYLGFNAESAFFTSRGYGYFEVNYRGSTGYGRAYREALKGNWGPLDLQDTIEGAQALVEMGLADSKKLVIKGGSAGGFTVLNALTHHPGFFKAGICSYGVSNLFSFGQDTHKFEVHYNDSLIGKLPEAAQKYHDWSAIFSADQIRDPLALFQGSADKVVPPDQTESMVAKLKEHKIPYIYRLYEGEGHGFRKQETLIDFYHTVETFLLQQVIYSI